MSDDRVWDEEEIPEPGEADAFEQGYRERPSARPQAPVGDLLQDLLPEDFDWRQLVREHPWPAVAAAALVGYLIGRTRGEEIVDALSDLASERVTRQLSQALAEPTEE